jgi:hypothetical protein
MAFSGGSFATSWPDIGYGFGFILQVAKRIAAFLWHLCDNRTTRKMCQLRKAEGMTADSTVFCPVLRAGGDGWAKTMMARVFVTSFSQDCHIGHQKFISLTQSRYMKA